MALSEKCIAEQILGDLLQYISEQGGTLPSERLQPFYAKYPTYRAVVKNLRSFCETYPDRISICPGQGPHYCLKIAGLNEKQVVERLRTFMQKQSGVVRLPDLGDFSFKNPACCKAILAGGRSLIQFLQQHQNVFTLIPDSEGIFVKVSLSSTTNSSSPAETSAREKQVAAELALFLASKGGSMLACNLHQYYDMHPDHRPLINKVPAFCESHTGLLVYQRDTSGGKLALPKHCCSFLRGCCDKKDDHQGFLHRQVPDGAVHCQHGEQCSFGHWERIVAQAQAGRKGKGKGKVKGKEGKGRVGDVTPNVVAASLALHLRQNGGSIRGNELGDYYKLHPTHKDFISSPGLRSFLSSYDGLFTFEPDQTSGRLCLASFCCHFLRDVCKGKKDHQGKRHARPASSLVACNLRDDCAHGHWQRIAQTAAGAVTNNVASKSSGCAETEVPVSQIRWSHDSIRVVFQDVRLVAMMLKELLDGTLLVQEIPQMEVVEDDGLMYAWTGNRRLWVLKEFERLCKVEVKVKVKMKSGKLPKKSPKFSTTNSGESVTFFSQKRDDHFPSMSFALAAINPSTAASAWDLELGHEVHMRRGLPLWKIERMRELSVWQVPAPTQDLLEYFQGKPYLFVVTEGTADRVVTLTSCVDALKLLGFDADPSVKISSLENVQAVDEDTAEFLQDPDAYGSQSGEDEAVGGYSASALEEVLRSVCSTQPLSLFSLPELVGLPNTADMCGELLSFLRQRSNVFNVSSSLFGHTVALLETDPIAEGHDADGGGTEAENPLVGEEHHVIDCAARGSEDVGETDMGQTSLSRHLYSVIKYAGGSFRLAHLEWDEVCIAEFASQLELETYLRQQPQFRVWDSEDGKMVSLIASRSSAGSSSVAMGSRWGRANRAGESLPVSEDPMEEATFDGLERRFSGCEELHSFHDRKEPIQEVGELVQVTKHNSMGCAVVSFKDVGVRQAILAEGDRQVIDDVLVEIKGYRKKDTMEDVPTDIFVAWGRQVEKRCPLSETEILKYFESKCREVSVAPRQFPQLRAEAPPWQPNDFEAWEAEDVEAEPGLPSVTDTSDISSPKRREDEDAGAFRMLLPSRLNGEISTEVLEILQSSAHRLLYQVDSPIKVALRSGWFRGPLPTTVLSQRDVEEVAKRLGWKDLCGTLQIPGSPHRVTFGGENDRLSNVTVHVGRYLPGVGDKAKDLVDMGSAIFVGPAGCGKTTILRDVAVNLSTDLQVVVVDFSGDLADISCDVAYRSGNSDVEEIRRAIREHVPEVIVAEFLDTYAALHAGRLCHEAGVRLFCSVQSNLQFLVEAFVHAYVGPRRVRDLACLTFPFAAAVLLSRQTEEWTVYRDAPAEVCSIGRSRLPRCELHHGAASPPTADVLDPRSSLAADQGEVDHGAEAHDEMSDACG